MSEADQSSVVGERRPLKSRQTGWAKRVATALAGTGVSPNAISVTSVVFAALACTAFVSTAHVDAGWARRLLWLAAAACVQLRLLANMFDGMVAIQTNRSSPVGELYNEAPDRIADPLILIGVGYAYGSTPALGYVAACVALFVAYVRALGKSAGASQQFCGPMAKPQRMFIVTCVAMLCVVLPRAWQHFWWGPHDRWGLTQIALGVVILGGLFTAWRRLARIAAELRSQAT